MNNSSFDTFLLQVEALHRTIGEQGERERKYCPKNFGTITQEINEETAERAYIEIEQSERIVDYLVRESATIRKVTKVIDANFTGTKKTMQGGRGFTTHATEDNDLHSIIYAKIARADLYKTEYLRQHPEADSYKLPDTLTGVKRQNEAYKRLVSIDKEALAGLSLTNIATPVGKTIIEDYLLRQQTKIKIRVRKAVMNSRHKEFQYLTENYNLSAGISKKVQTATEGIHQIIRDIERPIDREIIDNGMQAGIYIAERYKKQAMRIYDAIAEDIKKDLLRHGFTSVDPSEVFIKREYKTEYRFIQSEYYRLLTYLGYSVIVMTEEIERMIRGLQSTEAPVKAMGAGGIKPPKQSKPKLVNIDSRLIEPLLECMQTYFSAEDYEDLQTLLRGGAIDSKILFNNQENQLAELFKRIKYNQLLTDSATNISRWICDNFRVIKSGAPNDCRYKGVYDMITDTSKTINDKAKRICSLPQLPYLPPHKL